MLDGDAAQCPQSRPFRTCRLRDLRGRYRVVGYQSARARCAARKPHRPLPRQRADLWQRWVHQLFGRSIARTAGRVGRAGRLSLRQDENRQRAGSRSAARCRGQKSDRRTSAVCRRQWRIFRQTGAEFHRSLQRRGYPLVRGAGDVRRFAGAAADARACARANGHRRRRIHLQFGRRAADVASRCRRRAAGRRDALRRHHRVFAGRGAVRSASRRFVRALRAGDPPPRRLRGAAAAPHRMVSRSRADRADAVRWRPGRARWRDRARSRPPRARPHIQRARCRTLPSQRSGIVKQADAALDLISKLALAGAAAVILVRPHHVSRIAGSPIVPKARDLTRTAVRRLADRYSPSGRARQQELTRTAGRRLNGSAAMLALSVLADSAVEHYRGSFQNRAMYTPLVTSALTLGASLFGVADARASRHTIRDTVYAAAAATGVAGLCFHSYNILKRPGGWSWLNLFYAAPIGAPMAMALAGLLG